jgi:subtilisin family serine protease
MTIESAVTNRPKRSVRRVRTPLIVGTMAAAVTAAVALFAGSAIAATVEFKLSAEVKGREQRVAVQLAQSVGGGDVTRLPGGVYSITTSDDGKASSIARSLREQGVVLWAQPSVADAAINRTVPETEFHGRMLALTVKDATAAAATVARLSARTGQALTLKRVTFGNRALVVLPAGTTSASLAAVAVAAMADSAVASAERVRVFRHQWIPNDTMWAQQWSLGLGVGGIRAPLAWDITPSGSVAVAVIDTGIRSHPDLDSKRVSGYDMISNLFISGDDDGRDSDPSDPGDADYGLDCSGGFNFMSSWHGTHVAGIIAASTNNGAGIAGVAPNARIVPVRALGRCGGTAEDVADSIRWAAGVPVAGVPNNPNPAKVINLSLGGYSPCSANEQAAVDGALARGAVVVVAAGNDATLASDFSPANCRGVIAVAASNLLGDLSSYSNFGSTVRITAPGGDSGNLPGVLSTLNGGITMPAAPSYATYMGTSMAAPHVAGVVALMLARDPTLTPGQVQNRLTAAARAFPAGADCAAAVGACGAGLLDAANAVAAVTLTRAPADIAVAPDRLRLVELRNDLSDRYLLTADPVELAQYLSGQRGGAWTRTGYVIDTFSFTALNNYLALPQPVCRARLNLSNSFRYSASTEECLLLQSDPGFRADGFVFQAAFPNGLECPEGSSAVTEWVRFDANGFNMRTVQDAEESARMALAGWTRNRVAFCAPN